MQVIIPILLSLPHVCSQKKEVGKKFNEDKGRSTVDEGPLDDPIAEKLRQQRCFPIFLADMYVDSTIWMFLLELIAEFHALL